MYDGLGMAQHPDALRIASRWQATNQVLLAEEYFTSMQGNPDPNIDVLKPVTKAELDQLMKASDFKLLPMNTVSQNNLFWVIANGKRHGIFKILSDSMVINAEEIVPRLGNLAGANSPASAKTIMPLPKGITGIDIPEVPGTIGFYKAAGDSAGNTGMNIRDILIDPDLEFTPVAGGGSGAFWVSQSSKRVALFVPDSIEKQIQMQPKKCSHESPRTPRGEISTSGPRAMKLPYLEGIFYQVCRRG